MNAPVSIDLDSVPLDQVDVSDPLLYQNDTYYPHFARLRREDPVHYRRDGMYGSFWSVTKFKDIMTVGNAPGGVFLGGASGRHHHHRPADGIPARQLHLDGPAAARRAAQGRQPDRLLRRT